MISPLKQYREKHGLSQTALATLIGVSQGFIGHIETGKRAPSPKLSIKIEEKTGGEVNRFQLRPDLFGKAA